MTVIYLTKHNCRRYALTYENIGCVKVQKIEDVSNEESNIFYVKPLRTFLGKSEACHMTMMSGAFDKSIYDWHSILLGTSNENNKHRWVYNVGDKVCSFVTDDDIYKYISNMGLNLTPYSVAVGEENIYFLLHISSILKEIGLMIVKYWIQIVKKTHLKK